MSEKIGPKGSPRKNYDSMSNDDGNGFHADPDDHQNILSKLWPSLIFFLIESEGKLIISPQNNGNVAGSTARSILTPGGGQGSKVLNNNNQLYPGDIRVGSGLHATRGYKQPSSALNSEFPSPRGSPKPPGSTFNEDIRSNKQGDMHFLTDKLRADV